jgi:hypothetical protein
MPGFQLTLIPDASFPPDGFPDEALDVTVYTSELFGRLVKGGPKGDCFFSVLDLIESGFVGGQIADELITGSQRVTEIGHSHLMDREGGWAKVGEY